MHLYQKLSVLLFVVFISVFDVSAQNPNTSKNITNEKAVGPIVVQWTPSDSIPKSLVRVSIVLYGEVIKSNNLTAYNPMLKWDSTEIGKTTTSGEVYAIMPSGTDIPVIYAKFIKWTTIQNGEQSIKNMQLGTWIVDEN